MKIRRVGAELFRTDTDKDGRTGKHEEADSRLSQFYETLKKCDIKNFHSILGKL